MAGPNDDRKRELACLRLASDLVQLAQRHPSPDLKVHCVAMAKIWSGDADGKPAKNAGKHGGIAHVGIQSVLRH